MAGESMVGADRHHIAHPALADAAAQLTAAIYLIACHEGGADPGRVRAVAAAASLRGHRSDLHQKPHGHEQLLP